MSIAKLSIAAALLSATTLSAQVQQSQTPEEVAATAQAQIESHASPAPTLNMPVSYTHLTLPTLLLV